MFDTFFLEAYDEKDAEAGPTASCSSPGTSPSVLANGEGGMSVSGGRLVVGLFVGGVLFCACAPGTPMLGHERCLYMPTVEECQSAAASLIDDFCLRNCVIDQCRRGQALCGAEVVAYCDKLAAKDPTGHTGGYVASGPQTCEMPKRYVNWCQIEQSPRCQELSMVHERAHACGWHHKDGKGVPGPDGKISGCELPDH